MLNLHGITTRLFQSTIPTFGPGSLVAVQTAEHGEQTAVIERIAISPFYPECNQGVMRARVGSLPGAPFFIDYILVDDLVPVEPDFELELEHDPDYIAFLEQVAADEYAEAILG